VLPCEPFGSDRTLLSVVKDGKLEVGGTVDLGLGPLVVGRCCNHGAPDGQLM